MLNISTTRTFLGQAINTFVSSRNNTPSAQKSLLAAIVWLQRAHEKSPDNGVSHGFSLKAGGWRRGYVETTGYIICTMFDLEKQFPGQGYREQALKMGHWLIQQQLPDGSFPNVDLNSSKGLVFDTGQDLLGLVRLYRETQEDVFQQAAKKAATWLVEVSDIDGIWNKNTYKQVPHVYNTRSAWALLQYYQIDPQPELLRVALANLDWALSQQNQAGWWNNCAFEAGVAPFTHTIAYTARGLLESGVILSEEKYVASARKAAKAVMRSLNEDGFLPGQIATDGTSTNWYCCLTGNCQMAIVWERLNQLKPSMEMALASARALHYVMGKQRLEPNNPDIFGAIAGSYPIWGLYHPLQYPNWAAKFFIDALLLIPAERLTDSAVSITSPDIEKKTTVLGVEFDTLDLDETTQACIDVVKRGERAYPYNLNANIMAKMTTEPTVARWVQGAKFRVADGLPLVWLSQWWTNKPLPERVTGVSLMERIIDQAAKHNMSIYLLGGTADVNTRMVHTLQEKYPQLTIAGHAHGFFSREEEPERVKTIAESNAQILLICMGVPRQESFVERNWSELDVNLALVGGGAFDVLCGLKQRAPLVYQRAGLEWFYRLVQDPKQYFWRYLDIYPKFVGMILSDGVRRISGLDKKTK